MLMVATDTGTSALAVQGPIADSIDQIFEPVEFRTLADLFVEYKDDRERMETISALFDGTNSSLIEHFIQGNASDAQVFSPEKLFELEPAIKALDATYWSKALALTDIMESMPQARRDEWNKLIRDHDTPPFNEANVVGTLESLLAQRHKFFAERIDGIFRSLSRDHVTNRPEGFSKRMIINYVYNGGFADMSRCGVINDLRCVIARFMGREEPRQWTASRIVNKAREEHVGQWVTIDGGTLRIRLYKKGTAHLEVHPEIAWRLNSVLASIYPNAIPEKHRTRRSKRKPPKDFKLYSRPLPFPVIEILINGKQRDNVFSFYWDDRKSNALQEAREVLMTLGGVPRKDMFVFDYDFGPVLSQVILTGVIPDQKAYQFYPTPRPIAEQVFTLASIEDHHTVLEPSAGMGGLADLLPKENTTLVEIAALNCEVLKAKGFPNIIEADFLQWKPGRRFDRIIVNPPFTKSQWLHHVEHATELLAEGGRIVAVLPTGARSRDLLPGWSCTWSDPVPFPGTSIEIVILVAER